MRQITLSAISGEAERTAAKRHFEVKYWQSYVPRRGNCERIDSAHPNDIHAKGHFVWYHDRDGGMLLSAVAIPCKIDICAAIYLPMWRKRCETAATPPFKSANLQRHVLFLRSVRHVLVAVKGPRFLEALHFPIIGAYKRGGKVEIKVVKWIL